MLQTIITKWIVMPARDIVEDTEAHGSESKYSQYWTSLLPQPFNLSRAEEAVEAVGLESLEGPVILAHIRRTDKEKVDPSISVSFFFFLHIGRARICVGVPFPKCFFFFIFEKKKAA